MSNSPPLTHDVKCSRRSLLGRKKHEEAMSDKRPRMQTYQGRSHVFTIFVIYIVFATEGFLEVAIESGPA